TGALPNGRRSAFGVGPRRSGRRPKVWSSQFSPAVRKTDDQRRDLLEIIEDRYERRSTIVTSQVPVDRWWEIIANPTLADAILDRLIHNAYRIDLTGESMRKQRRPIVPESTEA
ncbi:ATP-binding protein, partial [Mesorhizobium sp.]|uniref:ATP-binding protein n=1 Tax=Mesorhizobium sp. TaxID=1871066 RepID=UPI0025C67C85